MLPVLPTQAKHGLEWAAGGSHHVGAFHHTVLCLPSPTRQPRGFKLFPV